MDSTGSQNERIANMHRFYVYKEDIVDNKTVIRGDDVKHITRVLRFDKGDNIVVCDRDNTDYNGQIMEIKKEEIIVNLSCPRETGTECPVRITIFQSIPKAAKMELLIQKGTELGIDSYIPVITSRTVVNLDKKKSIDKKITRWQKIAEEAAKQSRRGRIPRILEPVTFRQALRGLENFDLSIMPCVAERTRTIADVPGRRGDIDSIAVFIGPEGGFDEAEVFQARDEGIYTIKIGPRILRTETTGLVISSILMYRFGDLGGE